MSETSAMTERAHELEVLRSDAARLLLGRAVAKVEALPHRETCDSPNVLRLTLDDGSVVDIEGGYGGYTGHSCDEYVETLRVVLDEHTPGGAS